MAERVSDRPGLPRWSRRRLLSLAGVGAVLGVAGCDLGGGTARPTATVVPSPTPTQATIATPVASYQNPRRWVGRTLTVASLGGTYQEAQNQALFQPFGQATGAAIAARSANIGDLKTQVKSEAVTWDVACLTMEDIRPLARGGFLRAIDYQVVDKTSLITEIALQYSVGADFFSTVIAYPLKSQPPTGWRDFWDVAKFPGPRALKKSPIGTLEFALLADGVPPARLYPLDVERAFRSLGRIKSDVALWWEDGKQPAELVAAGEVVLGSAWNVRADLPELRDTVALQWYEGMLSADAWVVPRGAPNADVAMDFINYATRAVPMANLARLVPFGPVNRDALPLLRPDRLPGVPSANRNWGVQFLENWNYWDDNQADLTARFLDWLETAPTPTAAAGASPTPGPTPTAA